MPYFAVLGTLKDDLKSAKFLYRTEYIVWGARGEFRFSPFWFSHILNLANRIL